MKLFSLASLGAKAARCFSRLGDVDPRKRRSIGRAAKALGLDVMVGAMVETRLGITSAAHVCVAVGGARFVDLDTAWLLAREDFVGGYRAEGPNYELPDEPGQSIAYVGQ
jgi:L-alanine-DL-glutamate epimerase-like enolase superfamily enzyme